MLSITTALSLAMHFVEPKSNGTSDAAAFLLEQSQRFHRHFGNPISYGPPHKAAMDQLVSVFDACSENDWDGHGADSVVMATYRVAYRFLEALPLGVPSPSVGVEADGQITFEWHRNRYLTLSISVAPDGHLHYAALFGANRPSYGTETFDGEVPPAILDLVERVTAGGISPRTHRRTMALA